VSIAVTKLQTSHLAYVWDTGEDFDGAVSFAETGLRGSDRCILVGHGLDIARTLSLLQDRGIEIDDLRARGRLTIIEDRAEAAAARVTAIFRSTPDARPVLFERWLARLASPGAAPTQPTDRRATRHETEILQAVFDHSPIMISYRDSSGRLVRVNRAWEESLGWTLDDARGLDLLAEMYPDAAVRERADALIRGREHAWTDLPTLRRDGTLIEMSWTRVKLSDAACLGFGQDITARRRSEKDLRASEERFRAVFDRAPDAIVIFDDDGRFVELNTAACALFGRGRDDLLGRTVAEITAPGLDTSQRWEEFRRAGSAEGVWKVARPDGSTRDVEFSARADFLPGRHLSSLRDISERKRLESELRASEVLLTEGQRLSSTGSWAWTPQTGALSWSRGMFRIFGVRVATTGPLLELALDAVHPEDRAAVDREMVRAVEQRALMEASFRIVRPDGTIRHLHSRGRPVLDDSGQVVQFLGAISDVTDRLLAQERLTQSNAQLQALSDRLRVAREEEGARIAREVHDEIGQALTALQMDVAWLSNRVRPTSAGEPVAAKLLAMDGLLDKTMDSVQRIATELRPRVLDELGLEAAVEWYVQDFEKRSGIACRVRIDLTAARTAPGVSTAVFRVLQEALTNVWRHAGARQSIVDLSVDRATLRLEVKDDGQGIAADRVADPRSLGLLGMRERARALSGEVAIRGVAGQGTRVTLTIPL
jgi:two-component system, NarL family, sensor histidine kinase UhpB